MGRNILVVEDDHNISDLIHMYLVKEGFDVRIAGDGGKAIEEFQKQAPDLILLDIMLPVMDGWTVCARIRETSKSHHHADSQERGVRPDPGPGDGGGRLYRQALRDEGADRPDQCSAAPDGDPQRHQQAADVR